MPKRNISMEQKTRKKDELDQFMKRDRIEDYTEVHEKNTCSYSTDIICVSVVFA